VARYVRLAPRKARLVVDLIRGRRVGEALDVLRFTPRRAARDVAKVLRSAIANAGQKSETVDVDQLYVQYAVVNEGPRWKRIRPAPFGRAYVYQRPTSHIEIVVAEQTRAGSVREAAAGA
jgi:large subunit ribosomal protein L22